ncbi:MAG: hypothetical protein AAFR27_05025, partial [Pseudomonadota bacterium]
MNSNAENQEPRVRQDADMVAMLVGKINRFEGSTQQAAQALRLNFDRWLDRNAPEEDEERRATLLVRFEAALTEALNELEPTPNATSSEKISRPRNSAPVFISIAVLGLGVLWLAFTINTFQMRDTSLLFQLDETTELVAPADNAYSREEGDKAILITSTANAPNGGGRTGGVSITLPPEIEAAASGKTIEIKINAQQPEENASDQFAVAYSTAAVGNSGWR